MSVLAILVTINIVRHNLNNARIKTAIVKTINKNFIYKQYTSVTLSVYISKMSTEYMS